jgi:hypothetical protein
MQLSMAFNAEAAGSGFPATLGNISEMRGNIRKPSAPIWRLPCAKAAVIALDNRRCAKLRSSCFRQAVSEKRPRRDFAESAAHHNVDGLPGNLNDNWGGAANPASG